MLQIDKKYVKEFLGDGNDLLDDYCFMYKTYRVYSTINDIGEEKILIVQTPFEYRDYDVFKDSIDYIKSARGCKKFDKVITSLKLIKRGNHLLTLIEAK